MEDRSWLWRGDRSAVATALYWFVKKVIVIVSAVGLLQFVIRTFLLKLSIHQCQLQD
jgi:hypothetical protein